MAGQSSNTKRSVADKLDDLTRVVVALANGDPIDKVCGCREYHGKDALANLRADCNDNRPHANGNGDGE